MGEAGRADSTGRFVSVGASESVGTLRAGAAVASAAAGSGSVGAGRTCPTDKLDVQQPPSPGADVAGVSPVPAQKWPG